ncbi:HAUS augmin-like complex subunit 6 [Microtus ochrogaster]|uniref:HAUS augmin-like complex subunit 6 n=1 Tax=Microtus ochrogaster TaxID=79684 RepID=A0A8J6GLG4_MICOH|nr:HAUS augmin-like complex subunit 6 [Microtus ochrogaster]
MNSAFEKRHLWMYLQALGLDPSWVAAVGGKMLPQAHLGENMFDKLNRDAFHIVSYFLFRTLDESLAKDVFRDCWPPFDQKHDMEFRKHCCEWLKEISAECGSFPQVVGSLFLSPGGPKFIHLMYHFARYVAIKYIKIQSNDSLRFAETFNAKQQDMHKCLARCHVARNRFLQILQREHYVTQKYQENAQMNPSDDQSNIQEQILKQLLTSEPSLQPPRVHICCVWISYFVLFSKVRSLWTLVNETLLFLEKEREVVSSLFSVDNQCVLDGTNVTVNIPRLLLDRIEEQMCQEPNMRTPKEKNIMTYKKVSDSDVENSPLLDITKNTQKNVFRESLPVKKSDPFQKEQDRLAEEVARVVLSDSPQFSEGKDIRLEELIDTLISNPFLTRKQIPRTPENLITEIRSSWRKAVETEDDGSSDAILKARGVSPESLMALKNQRELSMAIFSSDFDQSYLPEEKAVPDQLKSVPQKPLVTNQISEPPTQDESDLINKKMICDQELECAATRLSETGQMAAFSLAVGSGIDVIGKREEDSGLLEYSQASCSEPSTRKTPSWDPLQRLSGFGILHETLPEEAGHLSFNSSTSSETSFRLDPSSCVCSDVFPDDVGKRQAPPEVDSSFQAILSSYEALKKSLNKIKKESHLSNPKLEQHKVELSPVAKDLQVDDTHTFLGTQDLLTDYTKPPFHMSLDERIQSVSPLTKVSLVEQKLRTTLPGSLREFLPNLKACNYLNLVHKSSRIRERRKVEERVLEVDGLSVRGTVQELLHGSGKERGQVLGFTNTGKQGP